VRRGNDGAQNDRCCRDRAVDVALAESSLAAPNTTISSGQLVPWAPPGGFEALHVGREHRVADAGAAARCPPITCALSAICGTHFGAHEAGDFDLAAAGGLQSVHQVDLDRPRARAGFVSAGRQRGPTSTIVTWLGNMLRTSM
jgi:hypothetical protein